MWLLQNVAWLLIGLVSTILYKLVFNTIPSRKLWKFKKKNIVNIVTANTPKETRIVEEEYALTGYVTEFIGASILSNKAEELFSSQKIKIFMSDYITMANATQDDLILFGGPVNNPITAEIMKVYNEYLPFGFQEYSLVSKDGLERFDSIPPSDNVQKDFALVMNLPNPFDVSKRVIIVAGCRTMGCLGGAKFLALPKAPKLIKKLNKKYNSKNSYALIIEVNSYAFDILGVPNIIKAKEFDAIS